LNRFHLVVVLFLVLFAAHANLACALSIKDWGDGEFFGATRSEMTKRFGPADNPGELDAYVISDSPDFMMAGMLGYEKEKVTSIFVVCQPALSFDGLKESHLKDPELEFVSESKQGTLFRLKKPQSGGPRFVGLTPPDDKSTGPMMCAAITNPFEGQAKKEPQAVAPQTKKNGNDIWAVLQGKWTNEHGGELTITGREIIYANPLLEPPKDVNAPDSNKVIGFVSAKGTIDVGSKDEFDTVWIKVSGVLMIGDSKGNPKKEISNYKDDQFFWIRFPDPNNEYSIVMSSEIGMEAIEPGVSKVST
jgi:hypothetical protein